MASVLDSCARTWHLNRLLENVPFFLLGRFLLAGQLLAVRDSAPGGVALAALRLDHAEPAVLQGLLWTRDSIRMFNTGRVWGQAIIDTRSYTLWVFLKSCDWCCQSLTIDDNSLNKPQIGRVMSATGLILVGCMNTSGMWGGGEV